MLKEERLKKQRRVNRASRIRKNLREVSNGTPRLSVFVSNRYFYAQIIDDGKGVTLVTATEKELKAPEKMTRVKRAEEIGKILAQKAKDKKIGIIIFDKGSYKYHGRVKAFADSAREGGLKF